MGLYEVCDINEWSTKHAKKFQRKVQRQLQSEVNTLSRFRKLKNEDVIDDAPGTSSDRPIGRNQPEDPISNEMRTTWEYAQLKVENGKINKK